MSEAFRHADEKGLDFQIDYRIVRPGGEIRHVQEIGEVVTDNAGRPTAHVGTLPDITEQMLAYKPYFSVSMRFSRGPKAELPAGLATLRNRLTELE